MLPEDTLQSLKNLLSRHEGVKSKIYKCPAGRWTIGVGRNLEDVGVRPDEIDLMLENDIKASEQYLYSNYPWFEDLDEVRQIALIDMCFCLGGPRYSLFRKMNYALSTGDFSEASSQLLDSRFASQTGSRALELAHMVRTGKWVAK